MWQMPLFWQSALSMTGVTRISRSCHSDSGSCSWQCFGYFWRCLRGLNQDNLEGLRKICSSVTLKFCLATVDLKGHIVWVKAKAGAGKTRKHWDSRVFLGPIFAALAKACSSSWWKCHFWTPGYQTWLTEGYRLWYNMGFITVITQGYEVKQVTVTPSNKSVKPSVTWHLLRWHDQAIPDVTREGPRILFKLSFLVLVLTLSYLK